MCVFYLVLRGLDTVEDDMSIPDVRAARDSPCFSCTDAPRRAALQDVKIPALLSFHTRIYERDFSAVRACARLPDAHGC